MEDNTFMLLAEAINWLKNPCINDKQKIELSLNALKNVPEMKRYYDLMYGQ